VVAYPVFQVPFLRKNLDQLPEDNFKDKYEQMYPEIDLRRNVKVFAYDSITGKELVVEIKHEKALLQPLIFLMRRATFVITMFFLRDKAFYSVFVIIGLHLIWMAFNHVVKPLRYESVRTHNTEIMNDWTILVTMYMMLLFTEIISKPEIRYNIGWLLVGSQGLNIAISLGLVLTDTITAIVGKIKQCCAKKKR